MTRSVDKIFIISIKIDPSQSMLNCPKITLWRIVSHYNAPSSPVKVTNCQAFHYMLFQTRIHLRIKLCIIMNLLHWKSFFNPKLWMLLDLIINRTLIKKVSDIIVHIIIRAVLIVDQYDLRLIKNVQIVEIIMTKLNFFIDILWIFY